MSKKKKTSRLEEMLDNFIQFISNLGTLNNLINSRNGESLSRKFHISYDFISRWCVCTPLSATIFFTVMVCSDNNIGWSFVVSVGAAATLGKLISEHKKGKPSA